MEYERDIDGFWDNLWKNIKVSISCDECPCQKDGECAKYGCGRVLADKFLKTYSDGEYEYL